MIDKLYNILKYTVLILATVCAFGFGSWMCTGCRSGRSVATERVSRDSVAKHDSSNRAVVSGVRSDVSNVSSHTENDSLATIPGNELDLTFEPVDLQPVVDMQGDTVGREYRRDSGATHAEVTVSSRGKVQFKCKEDSLRYVCLRLIKDSVAVREFLDSSLNVVMDQWHSEIKDSVATASTVTTVDKKKGFFARIGAWLWNVCGWIGLVCIVVCIVRFIIKKVSL